MSLVHLAIATLGLDVVLLDVGSNGSRDRFPAIASRVEGRLGATHTVRMSRGVNLDLHLLHWSRATGSTGSTWSRVSSTVGQDDRGGGSISGQGHG